MERRRFSQTMASEWQTAFVVTHKMPWCALLTAVKNYNKSLEKLQDFFFNTRTKTKCSRPRPRLHDPRPRPRLSFLSSRRLETKTLVSRTTSLLGSVGSAGPTPDSVPGIKLFEVGFSLLEVCAHPECFSSFRFVLQQLVELSSQ